jgi:hypothetical protein
MFRMRSLLALGLSLTALVTAISCGSDLPTAEPAIQASGAGTDNLTLPLLDPAKGLLNLGLLACRPLPYAITRQVVGPAGGTVRVGKHTLVIPAGALQAATTITAEQPTDPVASVRFSPEGLQFAGNHSPKLTLDYSNCPLGRLQILKRIAYTTERLNILSFLLSLDNILLSRISANIQHFSRYAVAW